MTKLQRILKSVHVTLNRLHTQITDELQTQLDGASVNDVDAITMGVWRDYDVPGMYRDLLDGGLSVFGQDVSGVAVDGEKLSTKLHDVSRVDEITHSIKQAMRNESSWSNTANELVEKGITKAELPGYMTDLLASARKARSLTDDEEAYTKYRKQLARVSERVEKLTDSDTSELAQAYREVQAASIIASGKVLDGTIDRAVMYKARANAQRLLNTEIARAYGDKAIGDAQNDEDAIGLQLELSEQHDKYCECDFFAEADMYGMGPGVYPKDEFPEYPIHPHCILSSNRVAFGGRLVSAYKSFYRGIIIKICLESGKKFSVTVNHPILTSNGWVPAKELAKGNKIVACTDSKWPSFNIVSGLTSFKPYNNQRPPRVKDIFRTLEKSFDMLPTQVPSTIKDFHGDGRFIDGNINIINTNGLLLSNIQSGINQHSCKFIFSGRNISSFVFKTLCFINFLFSRFMTTFYSFMRFLSKNLPILRMKSVKSQKTFSNISPLDISFYKPTSDNISRHPIAVRDALLRLAPYIAFDNIIKIKMFEYCGHVYDLSIDPDEIYICNGVIVKNCACTITPVYKGEVGEYDDGAAKEIFDDLDDDEKMSLVGKDGSWEDFDWDIHK